MTDTKYGILFTLELLHKYFADGASNDFIITPSQRTQSILNGNKIITKQYSIEKYSRNTGLIYKQFVDVESQPIAGWNTASLQTYLNKPIMHRVTKGTQYTMTAVYYGTE